jgi:hypothetical protein
VLTPQLRVGHLPAALQKWKLPLGGNKPQLWERIAGQVEPVHEAWCPCALATKALVEDLSSTRVR